MKPIFLLLSFFFIGTLANAQQWELKWQGGTNYTFFAGLHHVEKPTPCPPNAGYCTIFLSGYDVTHTFDSKWGGYSRFELTYKLNEKWKLQYAMGSQLQRYQRHIESKYSSESGFYYKEIEGDAQEGWPRWVQEPSELIINPKDPEVGNTRVWYLRHQAGASYCLYPKLDLTLAGWADVLLRAAEYQMKSRYNSQTNWYETYGEYDKSGAGFKHTVAGIQAGLSYAFLPKLSASLSYSRSLTKQYKKAEFEDPGKAYANQLQLGVEYSLFAL